MKSNKLTYNIFLKNGLFNPAKKLWVIVLEKLPKEQIVKMFALLCIYTATAAVPYKRLITPAKFSSAARKSRLRHYDTRPKPQESLLAARLAQLVNRQICRAEGRGFESRRTANN